MAGFARSARLGLAMAGLAGLAIGAPSAIAQDTPKAPLTLNGVAGQAELHVIGDDAMLTFRAPDGQVVPLKALQSTEDTLAVLADPRLAFAEPALLAWAGPDLTRQRDRVVARARAAMAMSLPVLVGRSDAERYASSGGMAAVLQYLRTLASAGQVEQAIAEARTRLAALPAGSDDHTRLVTRLANLLFDNGHEEQAIAALEAESGALAADSEWRMNVDANLAALLARSGHYHRAFAIADATWRSFQASDPDEHVPAAETQFAWIRACALHGLGQKEKAQALMRGIGDVATELPDEMPATALARLSGYECMKDAAGLAHELAVQVAAAPPGGVVLLMLDPRSVRYAPDRQLREAAVRQPELVKAAAGKVRSLDRFAAAASDWRQAASASNP